MRSLSDIVADKILSVIKEKRLLAEAGLKDLGTKLSTGKISANEWSMIVKAQLSTERKDAKDSPEQAGAEINKGSHDQV
jgi:hypothetical protein